MKFRRWMEETDLSYLLGDQNTIPQIGPEKSSNPTNKGIIEYISPHGSYRYVYYIKGQPVSVLQIVLFNGKASVANVYTLPEFRRQGLAKSLMREAKKRFKSIKHSNHLSHLGSAWKHGLNHQEEDQ